MSVQNEILFTDDLLPEKSQISEDDINSSIGGVAETKLLFI